MHNSLITIDTELHIVELPKDFENVLDNNSIAKKNFETLSYSKKQWLVIPIKDAKTEETKAKRI